MMKKFIMMIAFIMGVAVSANAQQITEDGKFFDNTYVGATVGAQTDMAHFGDVAYPTFNLYLGKWLTPAFGLELNGEMYLHNSFKSQPDFVAGHTVGLNAMMNMNNVFHAYKGRPDRVEVVPFFGLGWVHTYGYDEMNGLLNKMGVNLAINLGAERACQINIRPAVEYLLHCDGVPDMQYNVNRARVGLEVGFTYKFGFKSSKGTKTHNFVSVPVPYYSQEDMDNREVVENTVYVDREVIVDREVVREVVAPVENKMVVSFVWNSDVIDATSMGVLKRLASEIKDNDDVVVDVLGYASEEGNRDYNFTLSERRAHAVYQALVDLGVNGEHINIDGRGATTTFGSDYEDNRVAIVTWK